MVRTPHDIFARVLEGVLVGVEINGAKTVQAAMKRNASAALDNADGTVGEVVVKRPKKKTNVWSKSTTRKTSRKSKPVKIDLLVGMMLHSH